MAILDEVRKRKFMIKTALGYVTYCFETLASIVKMSDGRNVEDCINELNKKITKLNETEEGEISFLTDRTIRFSGNYMVKMAGVVYTNINVATTKAIANTHTLGTIPEGFRPRNNITTQFSGNAYVMSISTEGKITSLSEIPVSVNLRKNLSWIAQ